MWARFAVNVNRVSFVQRWLSSSLIIPLENLIVCHIQFQQQVVRQDNGIHHWLSETKRNKVLSFVISLERYCLQAILQETFQHCDKFDPSKKRAREYFNKATISKSFKVLEETCQIFFTKYLKKIFLYPNTPLMRPNGKWLPKSFKFLGMRA